jgi:Bacterial Ig-like domain (group 1)
MRTTARLLNLGLAATLGAFALTLTAAPADAAFKEETGHLVTPGQPYGGKTRSGDWLGSYLVDGKQVFCVQFEYKAPDTDEQYRTGDELKTKWGDALPADTAANISYLLLRYGDTRNPDEAAALAHLLHSWTAPSREGRDDLNPNNDYRHIGYDAPFHLAKLPAGAQQAVQTLTADAKANRGPWQASITAPEEAQTIGTAAEWTVTVRNAQGKGMAKVPVELTLTDAELAGGKSTVTTDDNGTATVKVTPTGSEPKLEGKLTAPADKPYIQAPVDVETQHVVSTGGERDLTVRAGTSARTKPGRVEITKLDAKNGTGIPGAALRLTGKDKTTPAIGQDGKPLTGPEGTPTVLTTEGDAGKAKVENLRTPQEVCVVEVSPPDGYDDAFDPANPPSTCGTVQPGETLALAISNLPNQVPTAIPAGTDPPTAVLHASTTSVAPPGAFAALGVLAVLGSVLVGFVARRRFRE